MKPAFKWILGGFVALAITAVIDWSGAGLLAKPFLCNDPDLGVKVFERIPASSLGGIGESTKSSLCLAAEEWSCTQIGTTEKYYSRSRYEDVSFRVRRVEQRIFGPSNRLFAREVRYIFQSGIPFFESGPEWSVKDLCSSNWQSSSSSEPKLEYSVFIDFDR